MTSSRLFIKVSFVTGVVAFPVIGWWCYSTFEALHALHFNVGALILGESESLVELRNPATGKAVWCGRGMHRGAPTDQELRERDACVLYYQGYGYTR